MLEFLHWRTDPFLVDSEPLKQNTWLTANGLLESKQNNLFQTPTSQLLLYPLMIRKIDFVSGERLLQSFPYILLNKEWIINIRKKSLILAEKANHYFQKSNYNRSILKWQKKIINYLEDQQRLPFPLFRLVDDWLDYFSCKDFIQYQSARGEDFQLPLYLTEELAYLVGVIIGDGHLANYFINIIDSSKEHIENLSQLLSNLFNSKIEFFVQSNANAWNVNILGKWIVRFFNFLSGQPINARKYPSLREPLIFQSNDFFRKAFWRGLMDADGSFKSTIGFGTASKQLRTDFAKFLKQNKINYRFYEQEVFGGITYSLNVTGQSRKQFASLIGSNHPQKQQDLNLLLQKKIYRFSPRISTLRKKGFWTRQVVNFKKEKLKQGYFNFTLLDTLSISQLGVFLRSLRKQNNHTQLELASIIETSRESLSKYERNFTSIPISILLRILSAYKITLVDFLANHQKLQLHSGNSTCLLDTQPNDTLLTLLKGLQFKERGVIITIGLPDRPLKQYIQNLGDYFSIKVETSKLYNSVLIAFVQEFFVLRNGINGFESRIK